MDILIKILEDSHYKYYCKGIYANGKFYEMSDFFNTNAVKVQIRKDCEQKFLKKLIPLLLKEIFRSKYEVIYLISEKYYLFVEFVINSHILISEFLLKDFRSDDTKLYYIEMPSEIIKTKSSRKFNSKFGYYSLRFEDYLNKNYELKIGNIKKQIKDFIEKEKENVQFFGLFDDVKSFLISL